MIKVPGFQFSGIYSGIKKSKKKDLALIYSDVPAKSAAVFTTNVVKAAPVILGQERIKQGICQALLINSGVANAFTGPKGYQNAVLSTRYLSDFLGIDDNLIIPSSTGLIGGPLPVGKLKKSFPNLVSNMNSTGFEEVAKSIMTTDKFPKFAQRKIKIGSKQGTIAAVGKGAGMISPNMATMLCFIITDININKTTLKKALVNSVDNSFNKIIVDGDTSTNDSVIMLSNGVLGNNEVTLKSSHYTKLEKTLTDLNSEIAELIVKDGEGSTKIVKIEVLGARTDKEAAKIARTIGNSQLVKTAFFGQDPNWGRILAAAGRAGVKFNPDKVEMFFDDKRVIKSGEQFQAESKFGGVFKKQKFNVTLKLKEGKGSSYVITSDLSHEYVKINSEYRT
ncbi:MAG: bifunctional glutamate N-acetyltransferase/amino-acid acetyltransferase ArgJ [Thermodesulfobacteriota bacterium]